LVSFHPCDHLDLGDVALWSGAGSSVIVGRTKVRLSASAVSQTLPGGEQGSSQQHDVLHQELARGGKFRFRAPFLPGLSCCDQKLSVVANIPAAAQLPTAEVLGASGFAAMRDPKVDR
jgi:hypothetical protein